MLEKLKRRIGLTDDTERELLSDLLDDATDMVLDIIGRDSLPQRLESVVVALAVIMYNRRGTEGETTRGEGGVSQSYLDGLPTDLRDRLTHYPRKARVIGNAPDTKPSA